MRLQDKAVLREAHRLMGTDDSKMEPYKINREQRTSVERGKKNIMAGRKLTERKANKAVDEWLGK